MALSKITTNSIADDAVTTAKVNPAQTDITSVGTLTSATVSGDLTVDTDTLKVDSSNNRVGVGVSPSFNTQIDKSSTNTTLTDLTDAQLVLSNTGSATTNQHVKLGFRFQDGSYNGQAMIAAVRESNSARSASLRFYSAPSSDGDPDEAMSINSSGHVFKPLQPLTVVRYAANTEQGSYNAGSNRNQVICKPSDVQINQGSHFNTGTGQFTCPVDGTYRVSFMGNYLNNDVSNYVLIQIRKNGSSVDQYYQDDLGTWNHVIRVAYVTCSANDTLEVYNNSDSSGSSKGGFDIVQYTAFNYSLVG